MKTVSVIMCNNMHMDIDKANSIIANIDTSKYKLITEYTLADIIIIMTCGFGVGKRNSIYIIADVENNCKKDAEIIVTGCMLKTNKKELEALERISLKTFEEVKEMFAPNAHNGYMIRQNKVIISSGCLKKCSYCVYPQIEGKYVSKKMEDVFDEIAYLAQYENTIYITGALETSDYGIDLYKIRKIAELLDQACEQNPNCNFIVGWFHPAGLTEDVLSVLEKRKNIVEIMLHIQHINDEILKSMHRPSFEFTDTRVRRLKKSRPDLAISTEVIVGYPGETKESFEALVKYLDEGLFQDIGVASYEPVVGTDASKLLGLEPKEVRDWKMNFIKQRYNCTAYPSPAKDHETVLGNYIEAKKHFAKIPKMLLSHSARSEYSGIAGTDTKLKMPEKYGEFLAEAYSKIINARDGISYLKAQREIDEDYTPQFRKYLYQIFAQNPEKKGLLEKAEALLL